MQKRNCSVLMIGLLVLGLLVAPYNLPWEPAEAQAQVPVIQFVDPPPGDEPRYTRTGDPINPVITVDVEVIFPIVETPCAGVNPPVDTGTLEVSVLRLIDRAIQEPIAENEWPVDTSAWLWTGTDPDRVEGQVTIGGLASGQDRSQYCVKVCINNALGTNCERGGYLRAEVPVAEYSAAVFSATRGAGFSQGGATCNLIPGAAIGFINGAMASTEFYTIVPPNGAGTVQFIGIPLLNSINMTASPSVPPANDVLLAEVGVSGIDLSGIGFPGTNCVISGKADGSLLGEVSPLWDLDGSIRIYDIDLSLGGGAGTCDLVADPSCELNVKFDGNP